MFFGSPLAAEVLEVLAWHAILYDILNVWIWKRQFSYFFPSAWVTSLLPNNVSSFMWNFILYILHKNWVVS